MRRVEVLIGWLLAICVHPVAAWHARSLRYRWALVGGYAGVGYLTALAVLVLH
jgi:hypothetical protein